MISARTIVCGLVFACGSPGVMAEHSLDDKWSEMIRADYNAISKLKCNEIIREVMSSTVGNNGRRSERWLVNLCGKTLTYDVDFFPRQHFPGRGEEFEIKRIQ